MKVGLSSYTYTWEIGVPGYPPRRPLSAEGLIERAGKLGVGVVQFADNLPLHTCSPDQLDDLVELARTRNLDLEVGTRGVGDENIRRYLKLAVAMASPILRVVVDTAGFHPTPDEVVESLAVHRRAFERAGVKLAIENHDRFPAAVLADVVTRLGTDWVGVCLDTVNSFGSLEGPDVVVRMLAPLAINLHVKDFAVVRADHAMGFQVEGRPAGAGQLDIPWLLDRLREAGRDPNAVIELWTPLAANLDETIETERAWAETSVAFLSGILSENRAKPARSDNSSALQGLHIPER